MKKFIFLHKFIFVFIPCFKFTFVFVQYAKFIFVFVPYFKFIFVFIPYFCVYHEAFDVTICGDGLNIQLDF